MKHAKTDFNPAQALLELPLLLLFGGVVYYCIEMCFRGRSHWTMVLCGAFCFFTIYKINERLTHRSVALCALLGTLVITAVELLAGYVLNIRLGWHIWDYSELPLHFYGQICPLFTLLWFLLCLPASLICRLMRTMIFCDEQKAS